MRFAGGEGRQNFDTKAQRREEEKRKKNRAKERTAKMRLTALVVCVLTCGGGAVAQVSNGTTSTMVAPTAAGFRGLPAVDAEFDRQIKELVVKAKLDERTPASENPDNEDEWASICVVDLADVNHPRVGGWEMENFVYPASTYKMYVMGEAIRQVCEGKLSLDQPTTISQNNDRGDGRLVAGTAAPLAEVLRLMCMYSDNTAANVAIDTVRRENATALLDSLGCRGSDITRKYLPRTREDAKYTSAPGTVSNALHFATFLWAAETGTIGGGRGRGLIKGYLGTNVQSKGRFDAGLPPSATLYSKTGEWNTFTSEAALVEDGERKFIVVVLTAMPYEKAAPRMAEFVGDVYELLK